MPVWCLRFGIVKSAEVSSPDKEQYTRSLVDLASRAGLHRVGVARAEVLHRARHALDERKSHGLHNEMQFTFRNPSRSTDPHKTMPTAKSLIVGALSYASLLPEHSTKTDARVESEGTDRYLARIARYVWSDYYEQLKTMLRVVADRLNEDGFRSIILADDNSIVDREVAYQAGLGWFGKNSNLLIEGAGSYFVLGCIVTDAELVVADQTVEDGCGSCRRCLDDCPTNAIVAPGVVDANRCLSWLLQKPGVFDPRFRAALGDRIYGCDDCQEVCPPTVRFERKNPSSSAHSGQQSVRAFASVLEILTSDDATLLKEFGAWYIAARDPKWLRRNALIILGNIGDPADERVAEILGDYLSHRDAVLRAHAVWATARLGLHDLLPQSDPDELVLTELRNLADSSPGSSPDII